MSSRNRYRGHKIKAEEFSLQPKVRQGRRGGWFRSLRGNKIYLRYIMFLWVTWFALIHYYERTVIGRAMSKCDWSLWEPWNRGDIPHRTALLADPQIMDAHSYPGRPRIINWFTQQILDNYHRKNWLYMHAYLDPDSVFFLGDLFDGGRKWKQDYWGQEYKRFNKIFDKRPNIYTVMSLPGNHDIGFGNDVIESSLKRFTAFFGDTSSKHNIGNHTFVLLDSVSLSNRNDEKISRIPREFLDSFNINDQKYPRILLTHVPLWRNPGKDACGPERESKNPFPYEKGEQYQTLIDEELTSMILSKTQPSMVFSGDDHDYCHINHSYTANGESVMVEEITVKSCAMNMGIKRPAIELLSLYNPQQNELSKSIELETNHATFKTKICYLPNPYKPFTMYLLHLVISLGIMIWMNFFPSSFNKKVGVRLNDYFGDIKGALLPISNKKDDSYNLNVIKRHSNYLVNERVDPKAFFLNSGLLLSLVLITFAYHYKSI
ncbi:putative lipid phosphatase CDC1 Ecym_4184 [Eremothecium cymbalariae DBVPG|uniref:Calcineurin-like phosphoesterase domain-containing protein n=1 Tax=Eremothecium cymbalariae (strain CBS 270.75 / DBVPG 7215 / KCTC 17166 / NRRL Y-17582) TaxID=931890 RepID=G8JTA7_ERECY|nr:hypothetical protein Ecym_4184 [Eremothecium cymbalariae DBVPG\